MLDFNRLVSRTPKEKKVTQCKLSIRLAECCLEQAKSESDKANELIYDALSHLATIKECNIDTKTYDRLIYQWGLPFDKEAYILAKEKLSFSKDFLNKLILEGDDNLVEFK